MFPPAVDDAKRRSRTDRQDFQRDIPPGVGGKSNNDHDPIRTHQVGEASERFGGFHVVKGCHRHNRIERSCGEFGVENVTTHPLDPGAMVPRTRSVEHGLIDIDSHDVGYSRGSELCRQNPVATSHVQHARCFPRQ